MYNNFLNIEYVHVYTLTSITNGNDNCQIQNNMSSKAYFTSVYKKIIFRYLYTCRMKYIARITRQITDDFVSQRILITIDLYKYRGYAE